MPAEPPPVVTRRNSRALLLALVALLLLAAASAVTVGGRYLYAERLCYDTNRCTESLDSLWAELEMYSNDRLLAVEKRTGKVSVRRAFYPPTLDALVSSNHEAARYTRCPVYGCRYVYIPLDGGRSYLVYCPAHHRFHFDPTSFANALTPSQRNLHLFVRGGRVYTLDGAHDPWVWPWLDVSPRKVDGTPSPLDPVHPTYSYLPTDIPASEIQMLQTQPSRVSPF